MIEGTMELTMDVGIAAAICGLTGWMMSAGVRFQGRPAQGWGMGLLFGILMLVPMAALLPFLLWPEMPEWVDTAWLVGTVLYEAVLWVGFIGYRAGVDRAANVPDKESLKVGCASSGLLKNDVSQPLDPVPSPVGAIRSGWLARSPF